MMTLHPLGGEVSLLMSTQKVFLIGSLKKKKKKVVEEQRSFLRREPQQQKTCVPLT